MARIRYVVDVEVGRPPVPHVAGDEDTVDADLADELVARGLVEVVEKKKPKKSTATTTTSSESSEEE